MRLALSLFDRYRLERDIEWYADYAEPGYTADERGILVADWNKEERAAKIAEKLGYSTEWSDEWTSCDACHDLLRCEPDCYGWLPAYIKVAEGLETICEGCYGEHLDAYLPDTLLEVENAAHRALPAWFDGRWLEDSGYVQYGEEYETGWHAGQDDSSQQIFEQLTRQYSSVVFQLSSAGQFDIRWRVWVKE